MPRRNTDLPARYVVIAVARPTKPNPPHDNKPPCSGNCQNCPNRLRARKID